MVINPGIDDFVVHDKVQYETWLNMTCGYGITLDFYGRQVCESHTLY